MQTKRPTTLRLTVDTGQRQHVKRFPLPGSPVTRAALVGWLDRAEDIGATVAIVDQDGGEVTPMRARRLATYWSDAHEETKRRAAAIAAADASYRAELASRVTPSTATAAIMVTYTAIDGTREDDAFDTIEEASTWARTWIGNHPEIGSTYAVSADGIGKIEVMGCEIADLFPPPPEPEPEPEPGAPTPSTALIPTTATMDLSVSFPVTTPEPAATAPAVARTWRHLEDVRDELKAELKRAEPKDIHRRQDAGLLDLASDGTASFMFRGGDRLRVSRHALSQLAGLVLPRGSRGLGFLRSTAALDATEGQATPAQLASLVWAQHARHMRAPLLWRTWTAPDGVREVRAVLSQTFQAYDHLELVNDALTALKDGGLDADEYQVVDYAYDGAGMRLRWARGDDWQNAAVNVPVPVSQLRNSETGQSAVYGTRGAWTLWCSNGCGNWDIRTAGGWRANHTGRTGARIRAVAAGFFQETVDQESGLVAQYHQALDTAITGAWDAWLRQAAGDDLTDSAREAVVASVIEPGRTARGEHPTTVNRGRNGELLLASVVDAVTWEAQQAIDLHERDRMERLGGRLMAAGLHARRAPGLIEPARLHFSPDGAVA